MINISPYQLNQGVATLRFDVLVSACSTYPFGMSLASGGSGFREATTAVAEKVKLWDLPISVSFAGELGVETNACVHVASTLLGRFAGQ